jgi:hypothetical protein
MATTDAKAGFRLPWSSERSSTDSPDTEHPENVEAIAQPNEPAASAGWPSNGTTAHDVTRPGESPVATDENDETTETPTEQTAETEAEPFMVETESATEPAAAARFHSGKKPSKFLADLTKAMQTAAEDARSLALSQLQAEAKNHVEQIHARSSTEAADLRRVADDDVASVREWSKAEIARIREETEAKISERKGRLETEVEQHAAVIEREIEAVQSTVAGFEADMAAFFERLLAEEDPTQFATMAERLPEPPSFEGLFAAPAEPEAETVADEPTAETVTDEAVEAEAQTSETEATEAETETDAPAGEGEVELIGDTPSGDEMIGDTPTGDEMIGEYGSYDGEGADGEVDREAAFAAIQAAAEAAASAEVAADAAARAEAVADVAIEIIGSHGEDGEAEDEADPRVTALGLSPDYDAAEAEALASANPADGEEIPEINDDALAARLAGLVPNRSSKSASSDATATQVIVVGLVSVASIASFKRHLGRVSGVQSVGVSSGPDGEFVFAVNHTADIVLREAIPSLPSFQARVTSASDGVVHVSAHDPESDN